MTETVEVPAYRYAGAWFGGPLEAPSEDEAAMDIPPKDERCIVKIVTAFHTSYYDVVGCRSAMLLHRHR